MATEKRPISFDLFVGNLPVTITSDVIIQSFQKFGPIVSVQILESKRPDCKMGFVRFTNQQSVELAMAKPIYINASRISCQLPKRSTGKSQTFGNEQNGGAGHGSFSVSKCASDSGSDSASPLSVNEPQNVQSKKPLRLIITHVESPTRFWAQNVEMLGVVEKLQLSLAKFASNLPFLTSKPVPRKFYATQFSADNLWYRCEVCRFVGEAQSEVRYVDYGNRETVNNSRIVDLPDCLVDLDPYANMYSLHGVQPTDDPKLFAFGIERLSLIKDNSYLHAVIREEGDEEAISVTLKTADGVDVIEEMLRSKTCVPKTEHKFQKIVAKDPSGGSTASNFVPRLMELRGNISTDGSGDNNASDKRDKIDKEAEGVLKEKLELEKTVQVLRKEAELNKKKLELSLEKCAIKTSELQTAHDQMQNVEKELKLLSENTTAKRVERLLSKIRQLSLLRAQSDSVSVGSDSLEEAIAVATESSCQTLLDDDLLLMKINSLRKEYQTLQAELLKISSEGSESSTVVLEQLITERDDAKLNLYSSLREFVIQFSDLDALTSTRVKIEKILSALRSEHASISVGQTLHKLDVSETFEEYLGWKRMKREKLEKSRLRVEELRGLVVEGLKSLYDEFSRPIAAAVDVNRTSTVADLDLFFKDFEAAIDDEINLSIQNEGDDDAEIVQKTLSSLCDVLNRRLESVQKLIDHRVEFVEESEAMKPWLNTVPDVSQLQATAKSIRRLKSKLGHRLVDLQDLEEDDSNSEELMEIKEDLEKICELLQEQLEMEDKQLEQLSQLAVKHFPEMIIKHAEFSLRKVIDYNGLLKSDYTLSQYLLSPLENVNSKDVHRSLHCGKPVLLKKYLIGTNSPDDFLKRMKEYSSVSSSFLPQLTAVFFEMNQWQAVVVRPLYDLSLAQFVERKTDGGAQISKARIISCVLQGLDALHRVNLVHGSVNPNKVLIDLPQNVAVLCDYDFSKTPKQRAEAVYRASNGLKFLAPELSSASSSGNIRATTSADLYNFGLLIIWLHFPSVPVTLSSIGDLARNTLDSDTSTLVALLLNKKPECRPGTDKILTAGFFPLTDDSDVPDVESNPCPEHEKTKENPSDDEDEEANKCTVTEIKKENDEEEEKCEEKEEDKKEFDRGAAECKEEKNLLKEEIDSSSSQHDLEDTSAECSGVGEIS